jgi:hypothetical protein
MTSQNERVTPSPHCEDEAVLCAFDGIPASEVEARNNVANIVSRRLRTRAGVLMLALIY